MSYPVKEKIARNLFETIASVNTANGYSYDLVVERYHAKRYQPTHLKTVIYQLPEVKTGPQISNIEERILQVGVDVFILQGDTDPTPVDVYCNLIEADIVTAVKLDSSRGQLAIDTDVDPAEPFADTAGEVDGFSMQVNITYRTSWGDPYTVRA